MFIILTGSPGEGFSAVGPYATEDAAADDGEWARIEYCGHSGTEWYVLPLNAPSDPDGEFIIFGGDIENRFIFTNPFADKKTARAHGRPLVPNFTMRLRPPSEEAEEAA
jgi:hypothetical protein